MKVFLPSGYGSRRDLLVRVKIMANRHHHKNYEHLEIEISLTPSISISTISISCTLRKLIDCVSWNHFESPTGVLEPIRVVKTFCVGVLMC